MKIADIKPGMCVAYGAPRGFKEGRDCIQAFVVNVGGFDRDYRRMIVARTDGKGKIAIAVMYGYMDCWSPILCHSIQVPGTWEQYLENRAAKRERDKQAQSVRDAKEALVRRFCAALTAIYDIPFTGENAAYIHSGWNGNVELSLPEAQFVKLLEGLELENEPLVARAKKLP